MADLKDDLKQAALLFLSDDSWKESSWVERQSVFRKLKAKLQEALPLAEICHESEIFLSCSSCLTRILKEQCSLAGAESCGCSFINAVKEVSKKGQAAFLDESLWIQPRERTDKFEWQRKTEAEALRLLLQDREEQIRDTAKPLKPAKMETPVEVRSPIQSAAKNLRLASLPVNVNSDQADFSATEISSYTLASTPVLEELLRQLNITALPSRLTDRTHIKRVLPVELAREVLNQLRAATIGCLLKIDPKVRRSYLKPSTYEIAKEIFTYYGIIF